MAWTEPHTFTVGEVATAVTMNATVRDDQDFLYLAPLCNVRRNGTQEVGQGETAIDFNQVLTDTDGMHKGGDLIQLSRNGFWHAAFTAEFEGDADGFRYVRLDGIFGIEQAASVGSSSGWAGTAFGMGSRVQGTTVRGNVAHSAGNNLTISNDSAIIAVQWLGGGPF